MMNDYEKRIVPAQELNSPFTALFYGRSGTGKTTLACTFPKPIVVIDFDDGGTDSVKLKDVFSFTPEDWDDLETFHSYIQEEKKIKPKTIVIDTVGAMQDMAMRKIIGETGSHQGRRTYGDTSMLMKTWLLNFRNLRYNNMMVVFTAHERSLWKEEDESGEELDDVLKPDMGPAVMPSLSSFLCGCSTIIGYTFIKESYTQSKPPKKEVAYALRIGPHAKYITKFRRTSRSKIPLTILNPSYEKLVELNKR